MSDLLERTFIEISPTNELDADSWLARAFLSSSTETWPKLLTHPYVVVLGEAGAGKTYEFEQQVKRLTADGHFALFVRIGDLAGRGLDDCLNYGKSQTLEEWRASDRIGYFFLDSLDEARLHRQSLDQALNALSRALGPAGARAHVYVSCRISDWRFGPDQHTFEEFTRSYASGDPSRPDEKPSIHVVGLAPLTLQQVRQLARLHGVSDVEALEQAIRQAHAHMFVTRPLDVGWLCRYWLRHARLGSLTELVEFNVEEKLREWRDRSSTLDQARARNALTRLAGMASLCGNRSFLLPASHVTASDAVTALDPRTVLDDWSDTELQQLFTRAIFFFDEATHGRVRIHHRTVQDYLCAQWLCSLLGDGMPRRHVYGLLFHTVAGVTTVPAHLQPIAAWLALWDEGVRSRLRDVDPGILLAFGDPSRLPEHDRIAVLRAYVGLFSERERRFDLFPPDGLTRLASPALAPCIDELLGELGQRDEVLCLLLELIANGRLAECVPAALHIALDPETSDRARKAAIDAVAQAGTTEQREQLLSLLERLAHWEQEVAASMIRACFPDLMDCAALCGLLERVQGVRSNFFTGLQSVIEYQLPTELAMEQRVELLQALLGLVCAEATDAESTDVKSPEKPKPPPIRAGRAWLLRAMGRLLCAILDDPTRSQLHPAVLDTLELFREYDPHAQQSVTYETTEIRNVLARHEDVRRTLLWRRAERVAAEHGRKPTRYHDLNDWDALWSLAESDADWLAVDVRSRADVRDRLLAFDALWQIPVDPERRAALNERMKQLAGKDEALEKRLDRANNPRRDRETLESIAMRQRWARQSRVRKNRHARQREKSSAALLEVLDQIRSGTHFNALLHLYVISFGWGTCYGQISVDSICERYGNDIADAFREGMKRAWRNYEPPLPHEGEQNATTDDTKVGLAGLMLDVEDGLELAALDSDLIRNAARYAARELNGFPPWTSAIAEARPTVLRETWRSTLLAEYQHDDSQNPIRGVLYKLSTAPQTIRTACAPVLVELLETDVSPLPDHLQRTLEALLPGPDEHASVIERMAETRCAATIMEDSEKYSEQFTLWWCAWLVRDGLAALAFLEPRLAAMEELRAYQRMGAICDRLYIWGQYSAVELRFLGQPAVLTRLIPIVFRHIDPDRDVEHEGVYTPDSRDNAQSLRSTLMRALDALATEDATRALQTIADDPRMAKWRDWFLYKVEQSAARNQRIGPMSLQEAMSWADRRVPIIRSSDDLFQVAIDQLDDIRLEMETGDFSYRSLFTRPGKNVQETDPHKWLVARLKETTRGQYDVIPEEEIDRKERPDIRLRHPECSGPVSIELKVAENWSGPQLAHALENQLVGKYLRAVDSRHGIYLLFSMGILRKWELDGRSMDFRELLEALSSRAEQLVTARDDIAALRVMGIDFHAP